MPPKVLMDVDEYLQGVEVLPDGPMTALRHE
jgi:hypothetical protein